MGLTGLVPRYLESLLDRAQNPTMDKSCEFELTTVSVSGLRVMTASPQGKGLYLTVAVNEQCCETCVVDNNGGAEWNDNFIFNKGHDVNISLYATSASGDRDNDILLGKIKESLEDVKFSGQETTRTVTRRTQDKVLFALTLRSVKVKDPKPSNYQIQTFGLLIGINEYKSSELPNLKGCTEDVQHMFDFLTRRLDTPPSHIHCLTGKMATRHAILSSFWSHLICNGNIKDGDAMVIFYAGHGSRTDAPKGWVSDNNKIETLCPHDERTTGRDGKPIPGIPDRTINALLRRLASIKGDNITVIFDSCYSGGITRGRRVPRSVQTLSPLPEDLDKDIWEWCSTRALKPAIPAGFFYNDMSSHVLLAACRQDELAWESFSCEDKSRGAFTSCLIQQMYKEDLCRLTYSTLRDRLPVLKEQHPQCEGRNKNRYLFHGAVSPRPMTFPLTGENGVFRAEVGDIHGVVKGTTFAVYASDTVQESDKKLGILAADDVRDHSCVLKLIGDKPVDVPVGARAMILDWRNEKMELKVSTVSTSDNVQSVDSVFRLVKCSDKPDLIVRRMDDGTLQLKRLDPILSKYAPWLTNVKPTNDLSDVLRDVSRFNFHLHRHNSVNPFKQTVEVVLCSLSQDNAALDSEEPLYRPNGKIETLLQIEDPEATHKNQVFVPRKGTTSDNEYYGLTLKNYSGRQLFPYVFIFDSSDYSIDSWYHPLSPDMAPPLAARHRDTGPAELAVGYGSAGAELMEFSLGDGVASDITILKLFVSTTYVDMMGLEQPSPFTGARGGNKRKPPPKEVWDAWTYVLTTRRRE